VTKAIWALLENLGLEGAPEKLIVVSLKSFFVHFVVVLPLLVVQSRRDVLGSLVCSSLRQLSRVWVELGLEH
jgi:hypothetical protein